MTETTAKPKAKKTATKKTIAKPKIDNKEQKYNPNDILEALFKGNQAALHTFQELYEVYQELYFATNDKENPHPQIVSEEETVRLVEMFFATPEVNKALLNLFNLENYTNIQQFQSLLDANVGATFIQRYANLFKKLDEARTLDELHQYFKPMGSDKTVSTANCYSSDVAVIQPLNYNPKDIVADLYHWLKYEFDENSDGIKQPIIDNFSNKTKYFPRYTIYMRSITGIDLSIMGENGIDLSFLGDENSVNLSNYSGILTPNAFAQLKKLIVKSASGIFKQPLFVFEDGTPIDWSVSVSMLQPSELTQFFFVFANIYNGKVFSPLKQRERELQKLSSFIQ
jgi:hypothetical protein